MAKPSFSSVTHHNINHHLSNSSFRSTKVKRKVLKRKNQRNQRKNRPRRKRLVRARSVWASSASQNWCDSLEWRNQSNPYSLRHIEKEEEAQQEKEARQKGKSLVVNAIFDGFGAKTFDVRDCLTASTMRFSEWEFRICSSPLQDLTMHISVLSLSLSLQKKKSSKKSKKSKKAKKKKSSHKKSKKAKKSKKVIDFRYSWPLVT